MGCRNNVTHPLKIPYQSGFTSPFKAIMIDRPGMRKVKNWRKSCAHCTKEPEKRSEGKKCKPREAHFALSEKWAVGVMGCRSNGLSVLWAVGIMLRIRWKYHINQGGHFVVFSFIAFGWCCGFDSRSARGVQHYMIKIVSDLQQVCGFLLVFLFPPPIQLTATK
jgi:hypothetical protein